MCYRMSILRFFFFRDNDDFSDCEQIENGEVKKKEKKSK